ncbi:MAG: glycosyltransferase [Alphaproteobacteria bacterium]
MARAKQRNTNPIEGKVLHVITGLHTGGAERTLVTVVGARPHMDPPPSIVALTPGGVNAESLKAAGFKVLDLGMRAGLPNPFALLGLARIIRRERPSCVQSWMYHADLMALLALLLSGRRKSTRLFWGVRCSDMDFSRYSVQLRLVVRLCAWLSRMPDGVIANSEAGREVHKRLGYRPRRFEVVDNGIDPAPFVSSPGIRAEVRREIGVSAKAVVIAAVARVDPMKDYELLLAALALLPGVQALAIGTGTQALPEVEGLHRLGRRNDVPRLLAAADILVSSSAFGEGFSNAIAEGMAAGLPVVASDVGDARRIVGEAGSIVPPGDPEALAKAIRALAGNRAERRRLGAAGRRRISEEFSIERMVSAFAQIHR